MNQIEFRLFLSKQRSLDIQTVWQLRVQQILRSELQEGDVICDVWPPGSDQWTAQPGSSHNLSTWTFTSSLKPAADCDMDPPAEENMLSDSRPLLLSLLIYSCALRAAVWGGGPVDERPGSWNIQPDSKHSPDGPEQEEENTGMKRENGSCFSRKYKRKHSEQIPFTIKPTCKQKKTDWRKSPTEQQALTTCLYVRFTADRWWPHRAPGSTRTPGRVSLLQERRRSETQSEPTQEHKHVRDCWTKTADGESLNASEGNQKSLCSFLHNNKLTERKMDVEEQHVKR